MKMTKFVFDGKTYLVNLKCVKEAKRVELPNGRLLLITAWSNDTPTDFFEISNPTVFKKTVNIPTPIAVAV